MKYTSEILISKDERIHEVKMIGVAGEIMKIVRTYFAVYKKKLALQAIKVMQIPYLKFIIPKFNLISFILKLINLNLKLKSPKKGDFGKDSMNFIRVLTRYINKVGIP